MAGYALSPAARADLGEIWEYTAGRWGETQAERYTRDLQAACEALGDGTERGRSAEDVRGGFEAFPMGPLPRGAARGYSDAGRDGASRP